MINIQRIIIIIIICSAITLFERAFPFIVFRNGKIPKYIDYLGKTMTLAIMVTLLVYCLRNISFVTLDSYVPEVIALMVTVILHIWKHNSMLSVIAGTATCMIFTQFVF